MVYKKLQRLSGFTARVVELLEAVEADGKSANSLSSVPVPAGNDASPRESERVSISQTPGTSSERDSFSFHNLTIHSPDGRLLVKNMSLTLGDGENLFVSGANGSGKPSLFRVLAGLGELWRGLLTLAAAGAGGALRGGARTRGRWRRPATGWPTAAVF